MGEITEALRRAREERERRRTGEPRPREEPAAAPAPAAPPWRPEPVPDPPPRAPQPAAAPRPAPAPPAASEPEPEPDVRIPRSADDGWVGRAVVVDDSGTVAECFRHFALSVRQQLELRETHSLLVTSAVRQDGKTTVACNLALALASISPDRPIALVELDLRRPAVSKALGVPPPAIGLEHVLRGQATLDDIRLASDAGVDLYLLSRPAAHAHELLARPELAEVIAELDRRYEIAVLDAPPVLVVPDVAQMLVHLEACVTIARSGSTPRSAFRAMIQALPEEKLIGAFLNDAHAPRHYRRYDYQYEGEAAE